MASIFTTQTPGNLGDQDNQVSLAVIFTCSATDQTVTGIRYYKGRADGDGTTRSVYLRNAAGTVLGSGTRVQLASDAIGWVTIPLTTPVAITSGVQYAAEYNTGAASKSYANTAGGLSSAVSNPPLTAIASGARYAYGAAGTRATNTSSANYFVDVVTTGPATVTVPAVSAGPAQSGIEPGDTVTLAGTETSDGGAAVTSRSWRQISGPSVTLSSTSAAQPTFTAPLVAAATDLVFGYRATNSAGQSAEATVTHSILPTVERMASSGGFVGVLFRAA